MDWKAATTEISPLLGFASGSWGGEAGVLREIFRHVPQRAGFAVEFGQRSIGSGTIAQLIRDRGWNALYMDREAKESVQPVEAGAVAQATLARELICPSNINSLFVKHGVPLDLDCLVIDIDGLDYWVWDAISDDYAASLVVIEFNAHVVTWSTPASNLRRNGFIRRARTMERQLRQ